jgi:hypothetical protein
VISNEDAFWLSFAMSDRRRVVRREGRKSGDATDGWQKEVRSREAGVHPDSAKRENDEHEKVSHLKVAHESDLRRRVEIIYTRRSSPDAFSENADHRQRIWCTITRSIQYPQFCDSPASNFGKGEFMSNRFAIRVFGVFLFSTLMTLALHAQATRTWVSGVGDDVNPCSRTAPCKTFAGAISKTAAGGEIDVLDPGGFGAVTITKSITIDGGGTFGSILSSGVQGVVVNAGANDVVVLRNLSINGAGSTLGTNGVKWFAGKSLRVESCTIQNYSQRGITVELSTAGTLYVVNSTIRQAALYGVVVAPSGAPLNIAAVFESVNVVDNQTNGIYLGSGTTTSINNCNISRNGDAGLIVEQIAGTTQATISNTMISLNGTGIRTGPGASTTRISNVTLANNSANGIQYNTGVVTSFGNNHILGNGGSNAPTSNVGSQ